MVALTAVGVLLNIASGAGGESLRCLIAAGGTAGHVLPALAVADALRARGAEVTFAGTAGRAEARLAPEAGYELDTFDVAGIPRRSPVAALRAGAVALRAPPACRRILERRRPDVVLGGGGYVAGPMVLAAWTKRIPAALTEADAPRAREPAGVAVRGTRIPRLPDRGSGAAEVPRRRQACPRSLARRFQVDARRLFELPPDGPVLLVFGGSQERVRSTSTWSSASARAGPPCST